MKDKKIMIKPDIKSVLENEGVVLIQKGNKHVALCPFHTEKTPSFFVFQDIRFKCFGCGESGDVIDFIQKMYGLSFKGALKHLGIKQGRITPEIKRDIARRKRRAELIAKFEDWQERYCIEVSDLWFQTKNLMKNIIPEDLDLYANLFHGLPVWEYHREILIYGSDEEKYLLYQDVKERGPKWKTIST